jgi:hypothetical protein
MRQHRRAFRATHTTRQLATRRARRGQSAHLRGWRSNARPPCPPLRRTVYVMKVMCITLDESVSLRFLFAETTRSYCWMSDANCTRSNGTKYSTKAPGSFAYGSSAAVHSCRALYSRGDACQPRPWALAVSNCPPADRWILAHASQVESSMVLHSRERKTLSLTAV